MKRRLFLSLTTLPFLSRFLPKPSLPTTYPSGIPYYGLPYHYYPELSNGTWLGINRSIPMITQNGLFLVKDQDYKVNGNIITFTKAPEKTDIVDLF